MASKLTITDIAKAAGVSNSTVSHVINNSSRVSLKTLEKVRAVIKELNWEPPPRGNRPGMRSKRSKIKRKTNRIAILSMVGRNNRSGNVYSRALDGIESRIRRLRKTPVIFRFEGYEDFKDSLPLFKGKVDGVIVVGGIDDERIVRFLRSIPCVHTMGMIPENGLWDHVTYSNTAIGRLAADYFIDNGYTRAATFGLMISDLMNERCLEFKRRFESCDGHMVITSNSNATDSLDIDHIIKQFEDHPFAVFSPNDSHTMRLYNALMKAGFKGFDKLKVVSCDNEELIIGNLDPRPIEIDIRSEEIGKLAVDRLIQRLENPDDQRFTLEIIPEIIG